ncbi:MAG: hypothetical protein XD93_1021 [candidate division WS6 bacterium 34_10]|uniref:Uncharacterized protein n=1 Tax=candidate division WS6 bacterium 34_10 TaxID=1641389 RepID=A0A117LZJ5_9BACT|nr:MAG: hypothetical protein XD93_1021 [candidate division WS6 bacterium 34_10]
MPGPKSGSNNTSRDGFDFHHTSWENKGGNDKGTRKSSDWEAKNGGWNKVSEHRTDQNVRKGRRGRN